MAISAAGYIVCPLNSRWSANEVQHAIQLTQSSILVSDSTFTAIQSAALEVNPSLKLLTIIEEDALDTSNSCEETNGSSNAASAKGRPERILQPEPLEGLVQRHAGMLHARFLVLPRNNC